MKKLVRSVKEFVFGILAFGFLALMFGVNAILLSALFGIFISSLLFLGNLWNLGLLTLGYHHGEPIVLWQPLSALLVSLIVVAVICFFQKKYDEISPPRPSWDS